MTQDKKLLLCDFGGDITTIDNWLAWLEKQGEQKPTNKVKPKFEVDDWITDGEYTWYIEDIRNVFYDIVSIEGCKTDDNISHVDNYFHLWTIQDAKDGDVLVDNFDNILIYQKPATKTHFYSHCYYYQPSGSFIASGGNHKIKGVHPATKEQRDFLFKKMEEAEYE